MILRLFLLLALVLRIVTPTACATPYRGAPVAEVPRAALASATAAPRTTLEAARQAESDSVSHGRSFTRPSVAPASSARLAAPAARWSLVFDRPAPRAAARGPPGGAG